MYSENRFSIGVLESKLRLHAQETPQKLDFWLKGVNQEVFFDTGGSTGSVFFKMAAAAILDFE